MNVSKYVLLLLILPIAYAGQVSGSSTTYNVLEIKAIKFNKKNNQPNLFTLSYFSNFKTMDTENIQRKELFLECIPPRCNINITKDYFLVNGYGVFLSSNGINDEEVDIHHIKVGETKRVSAKVFQMNNIKNDSINFDSRESEVVLDITLLKSCPAKIFYKEGYSWQNKTYGIFNYQDKTKAKFVEASASCYSPKD